MDGRVDRLIEDGARVMWTAAHRVPHVFFGLNRYAFFRLLGKADAGPVTHRFDVTQPCTGGRTCRQVMAEFTKVHRSQNKDMGTARRFTRFIRWQYLRETDPFTEIKDPYEPVS